MTTVSVMWDCGRCGTQMWELEARTDDELRVRCGECQLISAFATTDAVTGAECPSCQWDTWDVEEVVEAEHALLRCEGCDRVAEVWLRGDQRENGR